MIIHPELQDHLAQFSSDELADELERRGYLCYNDTYDLTKELSDDELTEEWIHRGLGGVFDDIDEAILLLEGKGYHISHVDEQHHLWEDIYREAATRKVDDFMKWLNERFIKELNKWL